MRARIALLTSLFAGCGFQGSPYLDGDRPIAFASAPPAWSESSLAAVAQQWNPHARGDVQRVYVEVGAFDRCSREPQLQAFPRLHPPAIAVCERFAPRDESEVRQLLAHELGHLLGGDHVRSASAVMADPLAAPPVWQYTTEDERSICQRGRGGRCATRR